MTIVFVTWFGPMTMSADLGKNIIYNTLVKVLVCFFSSIILSTFMKKSIRAPIKCQKKLDWCLERCSWWHIGCCPQTQDLLSKLGSKILVDSIRCCRGSNFWTKGPFTLRTKGLDHEFLYNLLVHVVGMIQMCFSLDKKWQIDQETNINEVIDH